MESYEIALDRALVDRNEFVAEAPAKMDKAMQSGEFDKALSVVDRATRKRVAVRTVNEQFTETIAGKLLSETAQAFRTEVHRQSYPRAYRKTSGQKTFELVQKMSGVDEDTRASFDALQENYQVELVIANERIREAIHRYEPKETRRSIERVQKMMESGGGMMQIGGDDDDPIRAAITKRRALDERFMKQIHALLTTEQVATLPKLPSQVRRGPMIFQRSTSSD